MKTLMVVAALLVVWPSVVWSETCRALGEYRNGKDGAGKDKIVTFRKTADGLVTFKADIDVNTDGALASYKIDDLGYVDADGKNLNTYSALNSICNGVDIRRPDHSLLYGSSQCVSLIREFNKIRKYDWLRKGRNYVRFYAIARVPGTEGPSRSKSRGKPCEKDGYYVSQTAKVMDASKPVCDPDRWVDAIRIPAIVMPLDQQMESAGVRLGDLAVIRLDNGKRVGAIIGDTNLQVVGEATVIVGMRLRGQTDPPLNYRDTVALKIDKAEYVVFPGTAGAIKVSSNDDDPVIQAEAQKLYDKFKLADRTRLCQ